jgi:uncharacterized protein
VSAVSIGSVGAVAAVVFGAAALQRTVGFGFALFAVPLLAFAIPTKSAVVVVFLNGSVTSLWLAVHLHERIERQTARRLGAGAVIGAPLGVVVLSQVPASTLRLLLGVTTCLAAIWIVASGRLLPRPPAPGRRGEVLAMGVVSGVINTSLATSGPPLVYELRRSGLRGDPFRATISAVFVLSNLIGLPLLALSGLITGLDVGLAGASLLPCVAGIAVGSALGKRMVPSHFAWAVDLLLLTTGVLTIVEAL